MFFLAKRDVLTLLCVLFFSATYTNANQDLIDAIRSLDVVTVEKIVKSETFSPSEQERSLVLAEELLNERKMWLTALNYDVTTSYNGPSLMLLALEGVGAYVGVRFSQECLNTLDFCLRFQPARLSKKGKAHLMAGVIVGPVWVARWLYLLRKRVTKDEEYKKQLRKKYDDAVTIKQLVCAINVVTE